MILSKEDTLDWQAAITTTRVSTNTYDLGVALRDVSLANIWLVGRVQTTMTGGGSTTLAVTLVDDDNAALSSPATLATLMAATAEGTLVAGYEMFKTRLPVGKITQRYLGVNYTVASGPFTAGKVDCFFADNIGRQIYFPKGYVNY